MEQRSAVAKLCRCQRYPPKDTKLAIMTDNLSSFFMISILPLCQTPILAGLLLSLILQAPMSQKEVDDTYTQSMIKEMTVMESVRRKCTLNFDPFFGDYDGSVHPSIAPNRTMARYINGIIDDWIESTCGKLLYPRIGSKTISKKTAIEVRRIFGNYEQDRDIGITPIDIERIYHLYGIKVGGPCEMRQKWYSSNLQPRTYYAQGGDAFHSSKYLCHPFTELCDLIPATNRRTRVDPGRIIVRKPSSDVIYYDLTSFTSNLHVHREFMFRLANYCRGNDVLLLDSRRGVITVDLGQMIYEYTMTNLCNPEYTLPTTYGDSNLVLSHSVAGFLGVYGNISTATFIHGIVMTMRHKYIDENNVAGDDGLEVTDDIDNALETINTMGLVKKEKTFYDSEGCCIHLKRPITRIGRRLYHGQLVGWPSLEAGFNETDNRYPYMKDMTKRDRKDNVADNITAFLRKLEGLTMEKQTLDVIDNFLSYVYSAHDLPRGGCVPQFTPGNSGFVSAYERRYIGMDPLTNTLSRNYTGITRLPLRGKLTLEDGMLQGQTFRCNQNRLLRHLVILGYLHSVKESSYVFGLDGYRQTLKEYTRPDPYIYTYTILRGLPTWVSDLT
jgi:hypothetical protein